MKMNLLQWTKALAAAGGAALLGLSFIMSSAAQTLPIAGNAQEAAAQDRADRTAIENRDRDAVRGVREQDQAAVRTANRLNRDARAEARQQVLQQSQPTAGGQANVAADAQANVQNTAAMNAGASAGMRAADLGIWLNGRPGAGLTIADLANGGAFAQAGFREGDRIVSINGRPVTTESQFVHALLNPSRMNQATSVAVFRNGQQFTLPVQSAAITQGIAASDPLFQTGLIVDQRNPNQLVVDRVFPRTPAFYAGLRPGDVITTMNGNPITSVSAFTQAVQSGTANSIPLQVMRNGQMREISMATTLPGTTNDASVRTAMRPGFSTTNPLNNTLQSGAGLINPTNQSGLSTLGGVTPGTSTTGTTTVPSNPAGTTGLTPSAINPIGTAANPTALTPSTTPQTPTSPGLQVQPNLTTGVPTAIPGVPTSVPGVSTSGGLPPTGAGAGTSVGGLNTSGLSPANPAIPTLGSPGATGATGTLGGTGATAGGVGAVGGTGATLGGAGSTAGPTGGTAGAAGTGAAGAGAAGGSGGAGGGGGAGAGGT